MDSACDAVVSLRGGCASVSVGYASAEFRDGAFTHASFYDETRKSAGHNAICGASRVTCRLKECLVVEASDVAFDVCCAVASEGAMDVMNAGVVTRSVVVSGTDVASSMLIRRDLSACCVACASTGIAP